MIEQCGESLLCWTRAHRNEFGNFGEIVKFVVRPSSGSLYLVLTSLTDSSDRNFRLKAGLRTYCFFFSTGRSFSSSWNASLTTKLPNVGPNSEIVDS